MKANSMMKCFFHSCKQCACSYNLNQTHFQTWGYYMYFFCQKNVPCVIIRSCVSRVDFWRSRSKDIGKIKNKIDPTSGSSVIALESSYVQHRYTVVLQHIFGSFSVFSIFFRNVSFLICRFTEIPPVSMHWLMHKSIKDTPLK